MMNLLKVSLIEKQVPVSDRLYKIWYVIGLLRLWRRWVKDQPKLKLQNNFISSNCYTCIELNGHMLVKLIEVFKDHENLNPEMFLPYMFNSQPCEKLFRATRSMTSTYSTVVNYSIRDLIHKIHRITFINNVVSDLKDEFIFPRERKKDTTGIPTKNIQILPDMINIEIDSIVEDALENAYQDAKTVGMLVKKDICYLAELAINPEIEFGEVQTDITSVTNDQPEYSLEENLERNILAEDNHLLQSNANDDVSQLQNDIELKDYSNKNVDLSENSPYLKVTLPTKTMVIKKSAYCWLLDTGNGKITSDRLKRFIVTKRKEPTTDTKESKKEKLKKFRKVIKSESDSNSDGEIEYDDSTDTDVENFSCDNAVQSPFKIELEKYYAVQYEEQWYIGRIISRSEENFYVMKFLKQEMDVFVWPKNINTDISKVHESYIFYGPIDLIGCEPFRIARTDLLTINKKYKIIKKML
ncbi:hypothetical protein RN001_005684 [Aquatica leii]|uniref:Uncharacterized protein n=1 Tax=Aquatica leii TaxID=1421715 RepID=A0AAN7Q857_9COLE|nr:hypothetical protein RN001_005684 [Aquatica leii]